MAAIEDAHGSPERDGYRYPLYRRNDRPLPAEWRGRGYVWDIDNTYLITEMRGIRDLIRLRFEEAIDKRPVPGAVPLLVGLRRHEQEEARAPIHFVSASPHTMRETLERRMLLDGVVHDGIAFRDYSKLRYLRDIFGYKIAALLSLRIEQPRGLRECLFGDDREHDPWVYTLYARICSGGLRGKRLYRALRDSGVRRSSSRFAVNLADDLPELDPVDWIFIRRLGAASRAGQAAAERLALSEVEREAARSELSGSEPPGSESEDGLDSALELSPAPELSPALELSPADERDPQLDPRLVFVDDYSQTAALLHACGRLGDVDLLAVVEEVRSAGQGGGAAALLHKLAPRLDAAALAKTLAILAQAPRETS